MTTLLAMEEKKTLAAIVLRNLPFISVPKTFQKKFK